MTRRRAPEAGFTLLEVLVAVTLLGLLCIGLFGSVRLGAQGWRRAEQRSAAVADATVVHDLLRRMIATARPAFASSDPSDTTIAFAGEEHALALIGLLPDAIAPGLQGEQRLFVAVHKGVRTLMLGWRLDLPTNGAAEDAAVPLLDHVRAIRFTYYGPAGDGQGARWLDAWSGRTTLPILVRLHIERDGTDGAAEDGADIVARTLATANPECRYGDRDAACKRAPQLTAQGGAP